MAESKGAIRSITRSHAEIEMPVIDETRTRSSNTPKPRQAKENTNQIRRKRAISPVSISEAASLAGQYGTRKRRLVSSNKATSNSVQNEPPMQKPSHSRLHLVQTSTPVTPHAGNSGPVSDHQTPSWDIETPNLQESLSSRTLSNFEAIENDEDDHQILSPKSEVARSITSHEADTISTDFRHEPEPQTPWQNILRIGSVMTPHMDIDGDDVFSQRNQTARPRSMVLDTAAAQDVSLPSPSLSPVTAAANMQNRREYFDHASLALPEHEPERDEGCHGLQPLEPASCRSIIAKPLANRANDIQNPASLDLTSNPANNLLTTRSMMSIPSMVDTFEAMPEEMKSYLVYQFLRRCSKPVLHFVADVVNPALKCDFLKLLPLELSLNVIGNLDAWTLCRAAQVSKYWRHLIDSSEKIWKRLFDAENFTLPDDELQQAIREGWGWQYASQSSGSEKDLRSQNTNPSHARSQYEQSLSDTIATSNGSSTAHTKRSKRKLKSRSKPAGRKQRKIGYGDVNESMELDENTLLDIACAEGPYAAASAAKREVPDADIGLPSLKNLHLFKSIYMRHHIIRKTWMADDISPRHIAFRAHQRHVVTCLQFDADKILTGSDDANINVYDTKTGRLRSKLEGHEGGVWALQYEGNVLVSGSTDRTVRVWDIAKGRCTQIFQGHTSTVRCLQILMPTSVGKTQDGRAVLMPKQPLIITGSRDSNLRVWKLPKSEDPDFFQAGPFPDESVECPYYVRTLAGHHHSVRAIAAHEDTLVSGSYDCSVRVWKISTGETIHRLNGHSQKVYSVVLDTRRNRCISGSMDNLVKVWSLETGSVLFNLEGHSSLVGLLDLQQDRLVSAAADSTLRIWDPENGHCRSILRAHTGAITCFQHDGQKVISGSDRTLKMWNVADGGFTKDLLTDLSGVWQVKFNERRCVAAVQRNNLTYIEVSHTTSHTSSRY